MRPGLFALAVNALTLAALPAAGAALLGYASQPHTASVAIPPTRVTIAPLGARSPLTNIAMTQVSLQWDMTSSPLATLRFNQGLIPRMLDAIDASGRHDGGYGLGCARRSAAVMRCTLTYPPTRGHAPWATAILRVPSADGRVSPTFTIHPG